jgi:hypothetical protein
MFPAHPPQTLWGFIARVLLLSRVLRLERRKGAVQVSIERF